MTGLIVGLTVVAVGLYLIASAQRRTGPSVNATAELTRLVPTIAVGDFTARRAQPRDVERIIESMDRTFLEANGWPDVLRDAAAARLRRIDPEDLGYITVCHGTDGMAIGWGVVDGVIPDRSRCSLGFSMHPSARSHGLGTGALHAVVESLHRAGVQTIELGTRQTNEAMVRCITNVGGVEVRQGPKRLPDGSEPLGVFFEHVLDASP